MDNELSSFINVNMVNKMFYEHINGHRSWGWMIWTVYSLIMWYDFHVKKDS